MIMFVKTQIMFMANPDQAMSDTDMPEVVKTMAFGGVATGNMKA